VTAARSDRVGLTFAGLCVANGAFVPAVARLTTDGAAPLFVAAATGLFAGLAAAVVLAARGELGQLVRRATAPRLALVGLLGTALAHALFYAGARRTSAIDTVLCLQAEPVYSLLVAWLFLGHRPSPRRVLSLAVLVGGIALAIGGGDAADPLGVGLLLLTPICWQASHLIVLRGLVGVPPQVLTGARYVWGGLLMTAWWWASGAETGLGEGLAGRLPLLALQGVVLSYVGTLLWYQAISHLDLARCTAIVVPSIPLLSIGASFVLVDEVPTPSQWAGLLLTAGGVLAFVLAPHAVEVRERVPTQTAPIAAPSGPEPDAASPAETRRRG
jgi:drug/metabolite transporter (DMT)-like permease